MNYKEVFTLAQEKGYTKWEHYDVFSDGETVDYIGEFLTLSLIQKWLRDEHGIHVQPQKTFHNKTYIIGKIPTEFRILGKGSDDSYGEPISYLNAPRTKFDTYEQALLMGLKEALKLLP